MREVSKRHHVGARCRSGRVWGDGEKATVCEKTAEKTLCVAKALKKTRIIMWLWLR